MITPRTTTVSNLALDEDAGLGDVTSRAIFPGAPHVACRSSRRDTNSRCAGSTSRPRVCPRRSALTVNSSRATAIGEESGKVLTIAGPTASLLTAERTALNFHPASFRRRQRSRANSPTPSLAPACGWSTRARRPLAGAPRKIRRALRWLREPSFFPRRTRADQDNHIAAAGSLTKAVNSLAPRHRISRNIEVEAKNLAEVKEAVARRRRCDSLDKCLRRRSKPPSCSLPVPPSSRFPVEYVSTPLLDFALPAWMWISVGALTHFSARARLESDDLGKAPHLVCGPARLERSEFPNSGALASELAHADCRQCARRDPVDSASRRPPARASASSMIPLCRALLLARCFSARFARGATLDDTVAALYRRAGVTASRSHRMENM